RVRVDFAVFFAASAAHSDHVGSIRQVDAEFFLKRFAKLIAAHFLDQLCKCRAVSYLAQRKTAGPLYWRIIVVYRRARIGLHKFRNNQKFERLASKRRGAEPFQIEHRNHGRRYTKERRLPSRRAM